MLGGVDRPLLTRLDTGPFPQALCGHTLENSRLGPGLGLDHLHLPLIAWRCDALEGTVWTHFQSSSCYFHLAKNKGKQNSVTIKGKKVSRKPVKAKSWPGVGGRDHSTAPRKGGHVHKRAWGAQGRGPGGTGTPSSQSRSALLGDTHGSFSFPTTKLKTMNRKALQTAEAFISCGIF